MDISPRIVISVPLYAHTTIRFQIYEHLKLRKEHLSRSLIIIIIFSILGLQDMDKCNNSCMHCIKIMAHISFI